MKRGWLPESGQRGFTLVELIVALALVAIMAAMIIQIMGVTVIGNVKQINTVNNTEALYQVMEAMVADYNNLMATNATPLATFSTRVQDNGGNYGTYTVVENSYVSYNSSGTESVVSAPSSGAETLKVKITNGNITLTMLFTQ